MRTGMSPRSHNVGVLGILRAVTRAFFRCARADRVLARLLAATLPESSGATMQSGRLARGLVLVGFALRSGRGLCW